MVGPALDGIAGRQDEDYLQESLMDPQAKIAEGFPVEVSPMPPFGVLLSSRELEDVIDYLKRCISNSRLLLSKYLGVNPLLLEKNHSNPMN